MANLTTRSTKFAVVEETTEGTPVAPSSGSDFIAVQEGFTVTPSFNVLENAELTGTIGQAAPILGLKSAEVTLDHYLRHSGTEGNFPNFSLLLKSVFGSVNQNSTERLTTAGSTAGDSSARAVVELASGGTDFSIGRALLIKDPVNGYKVANVYSVSTNSITLAFNLNGAPGTGLGCGKCITYELLDTGVPLAIWDYRADGGAIQLASGCKVNTFDISGTANEILNASYTLRGINFYYNPIEITSSNKYLDFDDGGGEENAAITEGWYETPTDLASEIQLQMNALTTDTITVSYSPTTGKFTIETDGVSLDLLWNTGANTASTIASAIGYLSASDDTGATSYVSDNAYTLTAPYTPSFDSEQPLSVKGGTVQLGDFDDYACLSTRSVSVSFSKDQSPVEDICEDSGQSGTIFNGRTVTIDVVAYLTSYDDQKYYKFKENSTVQFSFTKGRKDAGNLVAGSVVNMFSPTAKISSFTIGEEAGIPTANMTLTCFSSSAQPEFYLNLL